MVLKLKLWLICELCNKKSEMKILQIISNITSYSTCFCSIRFGLCLEATPRNPVRLKYWLFKVILLEMFEGHFKDTQEIRFEVRVSGWSSDRSEPKFCKRRVFENLLDGVGYILHIWWNFLKFQTFISLFWFFLFLMHWKQLENWNDASTKWRKTNSCFATNHDQVIWTKWKVYST